MDEIGKNIDFADSSYKSCETRGKDLIIFLDSWDAKVIEIKFVNAIKFVYTIGSFPSGIYENFESETDLLEALNLYYVQVPESQPFRVYEILDIDDSPIFKVIAEQVQIIKT